MYVCSEEGWRVCGIEPVGRGMRDWKNTPNLKITMAFQSGSFNDHISTVPTLSYPSTSLLYSCNLNFVTQSSFNSRKHGERTEILHLVCSRPTCKNFIKCPFLFRTTELITRHSALNFVRKMRLNQDCWVMVKVWVKVIVPERLDFQSLFKKGARAFPSKKRNLDRAKESSRNRAYVTVRREKTRLTEILYM